MDKFVGGVLKRMQLKTKNGLHLILSEIRRNEYRVKQKPSAYHKYFLKIVFVLPVYLHEVIM